MRNIGNELSDLIPELHPDNRIQENRHITCLKDHTNYMMTAFKPMAENLIRIIEMTTGSQEAVDTAMKEVALWTKTAFEQSEHIDQFFTVTRKQP